MKENSDESRLWLIRHAPVDGPRGVIHDFDAPADLSSHATVERLSALLPRDATSVCSPARRTRETATALGLATRHVSAFREQNFGRWTGRRHAAISAEEGAGYAAFWRKPAHNSPPGGESFIDQIARVENGLDALPSDDVILVVHSGTIRAVLAIALGIAPENALRFVIDPLSLTRIDRLDGGWRVIAVNRLYEAACVALTPPLGASTSPL